MTDKLLSVGYKQAFIIAVAVAVIGGVVAVTQLLSLSDRLSDAEDQTAEARDEAEERITELDDELRRVRRELVRLRRERRQGELEGRLKAGTAQAVDGLSASVSDFECTDRACSSIQGTATFKNDTQQGSAVTCVFRVEFEDGKQSHFTWFAEHVPPKGESVTDLYFSSNHPSPVDFWFDSSDCHRGIAVFNPGPGDI